jgi:hypothetical protein
LIAPWYRAIVLADPAPQQPLKAWYDSKRVPANSLAPDYLGNIRFAIVGFDQHLRAPRSA